MDYKEDVAYARNLSEPNQTSTDVAGSVHERMRKPKLLADKWSNANRPSELRDHIRHPAVAGQRVFGLLEVYQILDQIGEFLQRHGSVQSFRHQREGASALFRD